MHAQLTDAAARASKLQTEVEEGGAQIAVLTADLAALRQQHADQELAQGGWVVGEGGRLRRPWPNRLSYASSMLSRNKHIVGSWGTAGQGGQLSFQAFMPPLPAPLPCCS